jgi:hypothetical protein
VPGAVLADLPDLGVAGQTADPETGERGARRVTDVIVGTGEETLVTLTAQTARSGGLVEQRVVATERRATSFRGSGQRRRSPRLSGRREPSRLADTTRRAAYFAWDGWTGRQPTWHAAAVTQLQNWDALPAGSRDARSKKL